MTTREEYERRRMMVADHILEHPSEFDMNVFGYRGPSCGTTACIAGTAVIQVEKQGLCELHWGGSDTSGAAGLGERLTVTGPVGVQYAEDLDLFAREYLGLTSHNIFYDFGLTPEGAAKGLLEEPYVSDDHVQRFTCRVQ